MSTTNKCPKTSKTQNAGLIKSAVFTSITNAMLLCRHNFGIIGSKGIIFSLDAMISFVIILFCSLLLVFALNNYAQKAEQGLKDFELEEKALMIADSLVKNHDENNAVRGACIYDAEKMRVKTNELSGKNIKNAKSVSFGKIFVKSITYSTSTQKETISLAAKETVECISAKRFVLIDGEKGIILIQTCREGK